MASTKFIIFISILLAFQSTAIAYNKTSAKKDKPATVVVEGKVYCQPCDLAGTWSLTGAEPILTAKVSVLCKDHKNRDSYYKVFETDENGYFHAELKDFKTTPYLLDHPLHACYVRPVSSPLASCDVPTNVNYGLNGSALRYENKMVVRKNYEAVIYAAGPLAFRPANCDPHASP